MTILKDQAVDLIDSLLIDMFQRMNTVKIPESDTSDIDKNNIRIFHAIFKVLVTAAEINSSFMVSERNVPYFASFFKYLVQHFESNIDKSTKKTLANLFKALLLDFSGLSANT